MACGMLLHVDQYNMYSYWYCCGLIITEFCVGVILHYVKTTLNVINCELLTIFYSCSHW